MSDLITFLCVCLLLSTRPKCPFLHVFMFFLAIAAAKVEDVREVLDYYHQFDDPIQAFRDNQRKLIVSILLLIIINYYVYSILISHTFLKEGLHGL